MPAERPVRSVIMRTGEIALGPLSAVLTYLLAAAVMIAAINDRHIQSVLLKIRQKLQQLPVNFAGNAKPVAPKKIAARG